MSEYDKEWPEDLAANEERIKKILAQPETGRLAIITSAALTHPDADHLRRYLRGNETVEQGDMSD